MLIISDESISINRRFFLSIAILVAVRRLHGLQDFARRYGINYGNLNTIKNHNSGIIKPEYLAILAKDFGISSEWLLLGTGNMFRAEALA